MYSCPYIYLKDLSCYHVVLPCYLSMTDPCCLQVVLSCYLSMTDVCCLHVVLSCYRFAGRTGVREGLWSDDESQIPVRLLHQWKWVPGCRGNEAFMSVCDMLIDHIQTDNEHLKRRRRTTTTKRKEKKKKLFFNKSLFLSKKRLCFNERLFLSRLHI